MTGHLKERAFLLAVRQMQMCVHSDGISLNLQSNILLFRKGEKMFPIVLQLTIAKANGCGYLKAASKVSRRLSY